jgi:hypothetical protein
MNFFAKKREIKNELNISSDHYTMSGSFKPGGCAPAAAQDRWAI